MAGVVDISADLKHKAFKLQVCSQPLKGRQPSHSHFRALEETFVVYKSSACQSFVLPLSVSAPRLGYHLRAGPGAG